MERSSNVQEVETGREHISANDLNLAPHHSGNLLGNGEHVRAECGDDISFWLGNKGWGSAYFFFPLRFANSARAL